MMHDTNCTVEKNDDHKKIRLENRSMDVYNTKNRSKL